MSPLPIVLDCDPGHDDAIALLLVLASPELELLGVTTTYGNQTLEKTTANALRVLELAGRTDVPVASGADRPLERELVVAAHVHGESGLDGPALPAPTMAPVSTDAVGWIAAAVEARRTARDPRAHRPADERRALPRAPRHGRDRADRRHGRGDRRGQHDAGRRVQRLGRPGGRRARLRSRRRRDDDRARRHARGRHRARGPTTAGRDRHDRHVRLGARRLLQRLPPRDLRVGGSADPRRGHGRPPAPPGARGDEAPQRRGRDGVRALSRSHRRRPLAADRPAEERPRRRRSRRARVLRPPGRADRHGWTRRLPSWT